VKNASDSIAVAYNLPQLVSWGVLMRDGIFYATMHGQDVPFEIALHGVRSESEAQQALALFAPPAAELAGLGN